jgi:RND family efflux transporter MFP subunit
MTPFPLKARLRALGVTAACLAYLLGASIAGAETGQSALTVRLVSPKMEQWPEDVVANGWITPWHEAVIASEAQGLKIIAVLADVGDRVSKGQELARLSQDSALADVHRQEAAVASAEAALSEAQANAARARKLETSQALSEKDIKSYLIAEQKAQAALASERASLEAQHIKLAQTVIVAVDDGVITSRAASLGNVVNTGTELFRLLRQSRVDWQAELDVSQLARIKAGQKAHVAIAAGTEVEGTVRLIAPAAAKGTGRSIVYVALAGDKEPRPGLYASGRIELASKPALTLPESALVPRDGQMYVFTIKDGSHAARVKVLTGRRQSGRVEITSGIEPDIRVVESGATFLSDGTLVAVVQ